MSNSPEYIRSFCLRLQNYEIEASRAAGIARSLEQMAAFIAAQRPAIEFEDEPSAFVAVRDRTAKKGRGAMTRGTGR